MLILLAGLLARADGWGYDGSRPAWKRAAKFLNAWTCSGIFGMLMLLATGNIFVALASFLAFVIWRLPGFNGWENYRNMFIRGAWTSAIGFLLIALAAQVSPLWALLFIPFSAVYAGIYAGGYKYLPQMILGFDRHVWIEHASGWAFALFVSIIVWGL